MAAKIFASPALKKAREERGWTQLEMCQMLEIELDRSLALSTYQKWEQGTLALAPNTALEISRFLKLEPRELVVRK